MSGLTKQTPIPTGIVVHSKSRALELQYANDESYRLPFELLRVYSPSAEVQGHGPGQETLQTGKRDVTLVSVEPVGHYALQLNFSDGHNTGIYSWDILRDLAVRQDELWRNYLAKLEAAGVDRDTPMAPKASGGHRH
ncbi:gamma-butyrobetaine hydroxylase-like domain-containing protein [Caballeronia sp.]|uniref:gamma-butyrobetaine hydroxylase-like domain-containing protein n=1 Tax=Caballeronia sp. TaxID=1931223 RepID=UPI003C67B7B4